MNRVKLNVKTRPPIVDRHDKPFCGICKLHISNYTCPKCNVPYCSLSCFKAEAHLECSEAFYRKEVEEEMKGSSRSAQDRRKMTDLLQRFEEQSLQDEKRDEDSDDERWEDVDLDKASPDAIWSLLSPAERDAFAKAMNDPTSKLARELLGSEALRRIHRRPWWESPWLESDDTSEFGRPPELMKIPHHLASAAAHAPIIYNILALCVAYAYVTRRLSVSPLCSLDAGDADRTVAQDVLFGLLPYLAEPKSTLLLKSVDEAVTFLWAKLDALKDPPTHASFSLLLADAASLFKPKSVAMVTHDVPSLLALSDMTDLFGSRKHVVHKLGFYAAHLAGQRAEILGAVAEEARLTSLKLKAEAED